MKNSRLLSLVLLCVITLSGCMQFSGNETKPPKTPETVAGLIQSSPLIIECSVLGNKKNISFHKIEFVTIDISVNGILRDAFSLKDGSTISILQSVDDETTLLHTGDKLLLLLDQYEGPVAENVYVIVGGSKGKFQVDNNSLNLIDLQSGAYYEDAKKYDYPSFITLIQKKPYVKSTPKSNTDIEKQNASEKKLQNNKK